MYIIYLLYLVYRYFIHNQLNGATFELHSDTKALLEATVWTSLPLHFINDARLALNT